MYFQKKHLDSYLHRVFFLQKLINSRGLLTLLEYWSFTAVLRHAMMVLNTFDTCFLFTEYRLLRRLRPVKNAGHGLIWPGDAGTAQRKEKLLCYENIGQAKSKLTENQPQKKRKTFSKKEAFKMITTFFPAFLFWWSFESNCKSNQALPEQF